MVAGSRLGTAASRGAPAADRRMPDMEPSLASCLIVMSGGALGTLARYGVTFATMQLSRAVPWGTILCNVTGSLLIGLVAGLTLAMARTPAVNLGTSLVIRPSI